MSTEQRQRWVERCKNQLQARRNVIELGASIDQFACEIEQHLADMEKLREEIAEADGKLPEHRLRHMRARLEGHRGRVARCRALIGQQHDEIALYRAILDGIERA